MSAKIVWRVQPEPTGRWRSFQLRGWPQAHVGRNGKLLAMLGCEQDYSPRRAREGNHDPLTIRVCHHRHPKMPQSWVVFVLGRKAKTLDEAKAIVEEFYERHPLWLPKEE